MTDQYIPVTTMDDMYSSSTDHNHLAPAIIPDDFGLLHDYFITASDFDQLLELIRDDDKEEGSADPAVADAYGTRCTVEQQQLLTIQDYEVDPALMMSVAEIESRRFDTDERELAVVDAAAQPQISSIDMFAACLGGGEFDNNAAVDLDGFMGDSVPCMVDALGVGEDDDDEDDGVDGNDSFGNTTMISTTKTSGKTDRSKRIVSERRRRGRMKDNLHALRSLVPSITKMDRASIVGDAILYVQSLQSKANRLKVELAELEASAASQGLLNATTEPPNSNFHIAASSTNKRSTPVPRYVKQMDACRVGEGEFYVKLVSNKGEEIAACLHKAIESLRDGFTVQSSNLSVVSPDDYALTFTLRFKDVREEMNLPKLKLWLSKALSGHDFILEVSPSTN